MRKGIEPYWYPSNFFEYVVTVLCHVAFLVFFLPLYLMTTFLGWTKIDWLLLDILSFPGAVVVALDRFFGKKGKQWGKRINALWHIHFLCRMCPAKRRALRDPKDNGNCLWVYHWNRENFSIPVNFGITNWATQYFGRTDLSEFKNLAVQESDENHLKKSATNHKIAVAVKLTAVFILLITVLAVAFC